ncbi:hypothetical protein ALO62_200129 [Pseudomonas amygdali pv. myricae]|nr:hypothetical protein ALO62_200129 [Pseudomonas amygdali pv. myricae]
MNTGVSGLFLAHLRHLRVRRGVYLKKVFSSPSENTL